MTGNAPSPKISAPPAWRAFMRLSGTVAILLFLAPTFYVVKYYATDRTREIRRARLVSIAPIAPKASLDQIAPPLLPVLPGNAADYYIRAIQSYADRSAQRTDILIPTSAEAALILEGARRKQCRFFAADPMKKPLFSYHDPDSGAIQPYRYPLTAQEKYRYLGASTGLALAMAHVPRLPGVQDASSQKIIADAVIRFGDSLGRERATRTHLAVSMTIQRIGLRLLLSQPTPALQRYVDAQQNYADAIQTKYRLLESIDPDNLALQEKVARFDTDPMWRREAVWALSETLRAPLIALRRPMETLTAKEAIAAISMHDSDPSVRAAANTALAEVARHGAVIRR